MDIPSVILIALDHLRWDAWGEASTPSARTPYLDGVANLGLHFDQAITSHQHPDRALDHILEPVPDIRKKGATTAIIGNDQQRLIRFKEAFDLVREFPHDDANPVHDIQETGTLCVRFLQSTPNPVFLCAHINMQDATVDAVDHQLGRMLAVLSAHGHTNTTIIITALSGEPGLDDLPMLDSRIRIPLIISGVRGQDRGERSSQFVSLSDLRPTLRTITGTGANVDIHESEDDLVPLLRGDIVGSLRAGAVCKLEDGRLAVRNDNYILLGTSDGTVSAMHQMIGEKVAAANLVGDPKHIRVQIALTKVLSRALEE